MGREPLRGPRGRQTKNAVKAHCREMWPLDDNMPARRRSRASKFFFLKPCSYLTIHDNEGSVKRLKNAKFTSKHQQADYGGMLQTYAQAPVVAVYLLWTTFQKGHLTEPVPSGGLWLRRAWGNLSDPTARGVGGGGKGGGGQGGGGGGSWGGRTSRVKGTAPLAIRAVPGALINLGGAISIRKQGPVDS